VRVLNKSGMKLTVLSHILKTIIPDLLMVSSSSGVTLKVMTFFPCLNLVSMWKLDKVE